MTASELLLNSHIILELCFQAAVCSCVCMCAGVYLFACVFVGLEAFVFYGHKWNVFQLLVII